MKEGFINSIVKGAKAGHENYSVLPSLTISQAILESGWGKSDLTKKANNLFGIKANNDWNGDKVLSPTKEFINGKWIDTDAYFRKYKSLDDSILDHAKFLNKPRYDKVRKTTDYKVVTREIFRAGYATDPNYPGKLNNIIEQNKLYKYDEEVRGDNMNRKKLVLDPGHGGTDPGATRNGYKEKDLTLKLCLDVEKNLKPHANSLEVHLTRCDDRFISLERRSQIANELNADAFLSKHVNSAKNNNAKGLETFHFPGSPEGHKLASAIQNELVNANLCLDNRGVKSANLSVLRRTKMQSALLEVCFINNKKDLDFFLSNYYKFVQVITKTIVEYFDIKYVDPGQQIEKPSKPNFTIVKDKINILLLSEHIAVDGFIKEGTSYVDINDSYIAIRDILESMGLNVEWDNELGVVTADASGDYEAPKDSTQILLLGSRIDAKTHIHNSKHCLKIEGAYIPIRDIFESLGFNVSWNRSDNMILITK